MGIGRSKFPITYEEACRRAGEDVVKRLQETFDRYASNTGLLPRATFLRDIFGDGMPPKLAEELYEAFHGGQKGIKFNDLLRGLVLLVHSSRDEKVSFLSHMLSVEGMITKGDLQEFISNIDVDPSPEDLNSLFQQESWVTPEAFNVWIKKHPRMCTFTTWLLEDLEGEEMKMSFIAEEDPPTFYQTLSEKHNVEQQDVMDLEKSYWGLKGSNGKFDLPILEDIMCPPLSKQICNSIFQFLDINIDGHIDLSEIVRGMAMLCRASTEDRIRLCFELLDQDQDGRLNKREMKEAIEMLMKLKEENTLPDDVVVKTEDTPTEDMGLEETSLVDEREEQQSCTVEKILAEFENDFECGGITVDQFVKWSQADELKLVHVLLQIILEVCHIKMGLRPSSVKEEEAVIRGYMVRFHKCGRRRGQIVNLISSDWFNSWRQFTNFEMKEYPLSKVPSQQKIVRNAPTPRTKSNVKNKRHFNNTSNDIKTAALGPIAEPIELIDIPEEETGVEPDEGYTHIVTPKDSTASPITPSTPYVRPRDDTEDSGRPGPVDNSPLCEQDVENKKLISLTNEGGHLIKDLKEYRDYYVLPNDVWRALLVWYGTTGYSTATTLPRTVIDDNGTLELYPIIFQVYKHSTLPPKQQPKGSGTWAAFIEIFGFIRDSATQPAVGPALPGDSSQPILPRRVLYYSACFNKNSTVQEMCEHMQQVLHVKQEDLRIYDATNEESPELLDDETKTVEDLGFKDGHKILVETRSKDNTWPEELMAVMKEVQEQDQEKQKERSKSQGGRVTQGATGLSNLGNTCFMNSALQCLSNLQPLTDYFTEKDYNCEINKENPLGMRGVMAKRYGELVQDLWSGNHKSIIPLKFRFTIARYAPQFNNFQQQDAQELLSFVLDGIHEDLNRVKVKPYRELPDSDDRPDDEVANEAWTYHTERNDSVIVDLFQGQLKSAVECTECSHKSVKFDPFTFLSLPLPMEKNVILEVIVVRLDGSQPIRYGLKQEMEGKYAKLHDHLTDKTGIPRFMLVDVFGGTIRSFPQDNQKIRSILSGWLYAFEIPVSTSSFPLSRSDSPIDIMRKSPNDDKISDNRLEEELKESNVEELTEVVENVDKLKDQNTSDIKIDGEVVMPKGSEVPEETGEKPLKGTGVPEDTGEKPLKGTGVPEETGEKPLKGTGVPEDTGEKPLKGTGVPEETGEKPLKGTRVPEETGEKPLKGTGVPEGAGQLSTALDSNDQANEVVPKDKKQEIKPKSSPKSPQPLPTYCSPKIHGFIFAVHRKTLRMENYFVSTQKNRPVLFSIPMVVPCVPSTPRSNLYECIWKQVQRLIIPDPPNMKSEEDTVQKTYSFKLRMVGRDGLFCCQCPWYRFCRGCPIDCDESPIGNDPHYITIEWNDAFLHLKYQPALERPKEDESMEALKTQDTRPIDLYECFQSFSKSEELGEDELWYCKKCETHRPARKTLEIWRLPPILIIHLKRFQFNNGRWVKSQRVVNFPIRNLNPMAYTGEKSIPLEELTNEAPTSITPPIIGEIDEVLPLDVPVEVHEDKRSDEEQQKLEEKGSGLEDLGSEDKEIEHNMEDGKLEGKGNDIKLEDAKEIETTLKEEDRQTPIYDLFATTCHSGILGGGHYTSFAKNRNSRWYYYNDSSCKETTEERVLAESPYILFFELRGLYKRYHEFRAKSLREGLKPESSPSPGNDDDDSDYRATFRTGGNANSGRGSMCKQQ